MNAERQAQMVARMLWGDSDPYANFPEERFHADAQGWNSNHVLLRDTIERLRPPVILEVGVWKGASTIHMAETIRDRGIDSVVIAVDTFLGSMEHWLNPEWRDALRFANGYPTLFHTFMTNVIERGLQPYIVPLPLDSLNAFQVLAAKQIRPSMVHIDAGHDYFSVATDLRRWWHLLTPGGVMVADDYDPAGGAWPEVTQAVNEFLKETPHQTFAAHALKCRFAKPPTDGAAAI